MRLGLGVCEGLGVGMCRRTKCCHRALWKGEWDSVRQPRKREGRKPRDGVPVPNQKTANAVNGDGGRQSKPVSSIASCCASKCLFFAQKFLRVAISGPEMSSLGGPVSPACLRPPRAFQSPSVPMITMSLGWSSAQETDGHGTMPANWPSQWPSPRVGSYATAPVSPLGSVIETLIWWRIRAARGSGIGSGPRSKKRVQGLGFRFKGFRRRGVQASGADSGQRTISG